MAESLELGGPGTALVEREPEKLPDRPQARGLGGGLMKLVAPIEQIIEAQNETRRFIHTALVEDRDYGIIPGTDGKRKSLLKPGAERVCAAFGTVARFEIVEKEIDHDREVHWEKQKFRWDENIRGKKHYYVESSGVSKGLYRYLVRCYLYLGDRIVGEGIGSCSTMESKYVDRPRDLENTCLKMGKKRSLIDATLTTFGLSDEFSQDTDDLEDLDAAPTPARQERQERAQSKVEDQIDQARSKLNEIKKERQLSKVDREKAQGILDEIEMIWDSLGTPQDQRPDDARVALNGMDVPRNEHGVPDPRRLGPEHMQLVLEHVRKRADALTSRRDAGEHKVPVPPPPPELTVRRVGKLLHIIDPLGTKECIGCGELLTGQRTAVATSEPKDYCPSAIRKAGEYDEPTLQHRLPVAMLEAFRATRPPQKPSDMDLPF